MEAAARTEPSISIPMADLSFKSARSDLEDEGEERASAANTKAAKEFGLAVAREIKRQMRNDYPRLARERGWEGTVRIRLSFARDGKVSAIALADTSGHKVLDDHALAKLKSIKLPPLPDRLRKSSSFNITQPVVYSLSE